MNNKNIRHDDSNEYIEIEKGNNYFVYPVQLRDVLFERYSFGMWEMEIFDDILIKYNSISKAKGKSIPVEFSINDLMNRYNTQARVTISNAIKGLIEKELILKISTGRGHAKSRFITNNDKLRELMETIEIGV